MSALDKLQRFVEDCLANIRDPKIDTDWDRITADSKPLIHAVMDSGERDLVLKTEWWETFTQEIMPHLKKSGAISEPSAIPSDVADADPGPMPEESCEHDDVELDRPAVEAVGQTHEVTYQASCLNCDATGLYKVDEAEDFMHVSGDIIAWSDPE